MSRPRSPHRPPLVLLAAVSATGAIACGGLAVALTMGVPQLTGGAAPSVAIAPDGTRATAPVSTVAPTPKVATSTARAPATTVGDARRTYNVLFITIDTLRHDLGFTGYPRPITPNLDALASRATVFERAYSLASYTPKSLGPLLIGRYASETSRNSAHYTYFFKDNEFLAERVHDAGGRTFAAVCHHYFKWNTGYTQGFDVFDTSATPKAMADNDPSVTSDHLSDVALAILSRPANVTPKPKRKKGAPEAGPRRFFGWFHYMDPHTPYVPHRGAPDFAKIPVAGMPKSRVLYDEEVWFTDQQVGRVLDYVAAQPWAKDTAIIVSADHGESFGERGHYRHGREVWESLVRVPLLVYLPDALPKRVAVKRSHIDLVPTVLDLMGIDEHVSAKSPKLHGHSLLEDVFADPAEPLKERDVFIDMPSGPFNEARRAVVTGESPGLKLIDFGRRTLAFDLASDPLEGDPLAPDDDRAKAARAAYDRARESLDDVPALP